VTYRNAFDQPEVTVSQKCLRNLCVGSTEDVRKNTKEILLEG